MKPIGPYVAARDLTGERPARAVRTLRATDRLTGMPVLLHVLPQVAVLPDLPDDPALLRPSEGGIDGEAAYLVTELPPHALPAADPLLTARGALAGLAALHDAGLAHGGVDPAQVWSVDGRVALAGAGLPWGGDPSPAGDLRDLRTTLDLLGGVPPALWDAPDGASARDLLARLDAPPPARVTARRGAAPREQAVEPPPTPPHMDGEATPPLPDGPAPAPVDPPASPGPPSPAPPLVIGAAPPGPVELAPGKPREAVREEVPSPTGAATGGAPPSAPEGVEETPPGSPRVSGTRVPSRRLGGEPVRITWDADGTRRVVRSGQFPAPRSRRAPGWLLPVLALLVVLLLAGLWWARRPAPSPPALAPAAPAPTTLTPAPAAGSPSGPCCEVRFTVRGAQGVPVRLSVVSAPRGAPVGPGQEVGQAPGVVRLPVPGEYTLRAAAEGYAAGLVTVRVPSRAPLLIALTP